MARNRTLLQLRAEVRQRADCENDPHISDSELTRYINQSGAALHALIVEQDEGDFIEFASAVTTAGNIAVPLVGLTSFYKLANVSALINGEWQPLKRWTWEQLTALRNASTWGVPGWPVLYRLIRNSAGVPEIDLAPVPDGAYQISLFYIAAYIDLVADGDTYDGRDGWEEWVINDAAIKCLIKAEESVVDLTRERDACFARISAQITAADLDHPPTVRDTASALEAWPYRWPR